MAKYIDADLLRKEIERHKNNAPLHYHPHACTSIISELEELLAFLDSLQQEQQEEPDKSLEEAAEEYSKERAEGHILYDWVHAFIAGAKWDREQMMKNAVNVTVHLEPGAFPVIEIGVDRFGLKVRDKVKVIIVKEDSEYGK